MRVSLFVLVVVIIGSTIVFAQNAFNDIEKIKNNDEVFEFRGCLEGLNGLIQDADTHIYKHSKLNFVEYEREFLGHAYGGIKSLSYRLIGKGKDVRKVHSEIKNFLSKWSRNDIWEVK